MTDCEKEIRQKKKETANNKAKASFLQSIVQGISQTNRIAQSYTNNTAGTKDTKELPNRRSTLEPYSGNEESFCEGLDTELGNIFDEYNIDNNNKDTEFNNDISSNAMYLKHLKEKI